MGMIVFISGPLLGVALGYARRGSLRRLARLRFDHLWLVWLALALQTSEYLPQVHDVRADLGVSPAVPSYGLLGLWLIINTARFTGLLRISMAIVVLGWAMNVAVMAANGGMPVAPAAQQRANDTAPVEEGQLFKHVVATSETDLAWLGDSIPVRPLRMVISAGDIALWLGVIATVAVVMTGRGPALHGAAPRSSHRVALRRFYPDSVERAGQRRHIRFTECGVASNHDGPRGVQS
jgi:hypothetical protein